MFTGLVFLANVLIPTLVIQWPLSAISFPLVAVLEGTIPVFGSRKTSIGQRIIVALKTNFVSTLFGAPFAALVFYVTKELTEDLGKPELDHITRFAKAALSPGEYGNAWPIYSCIFLAFLLSVVVEGILATHIMAATDRRQVCTWVLLGNVVSYLALVGVFLLMW